MNFFRVTTPDSDTFEDAMDKLDYRGGIHRESICNYTGQALGLRQLVADDAKEDKTFLEKLAFMSDAEVEQTIRSNYIAFTKGDYLYLLPREHLDKLVVVSR